MVKFSILINSSNLHAGGGIQVAVSFLYELSCIKKAQLSKVHVIASSEVDESLSRLKVNVNIFGSYEVINTYGLKTFSSRLSSKIKNYDLVFTVFGPNYLRVKAKKEIVGFAQPWLLDFDNPISRSMGFVERNILKAKFFVQWLFFLRADHLIAELEHVKRSLVVHKGVDSNKVSVVYNTVSSLYLDSSKWNSIVIDKANKKIALGIVTRDYPHKNLAVLPDVAEILAEKYKLNVHFYTTLNDFEWDARDDYFKQNVSTVGSLSPDQCPSFYEQMDGVVFPSLLECFSATPLEAMAMSKPLFSSDRGFVKDVCSDYSIYFDPENPEDIAKKIADYFHSDIDYSEKLSEARNHALNFSSARGRAEKYLEIIQQHIKD